MNKLKQIIYEFRLKNTKKNLKKNANKIKEMVENNLNYLKYHSEQTRLIVCKPYLENKLT